MHDAAGESGRLCRSRAGDRTLQGRSGTYLLHHTASGTAGEPLVIRVIPNTATGELAGLRGRLSITGGVEKGHAYTIDYELEPPSGVDRLARAVVEDRVGAAWRTCAIE